MVQKATAGKSGGEWAAAMSKIKSSARSARSKPADGPPGPLMMRGGKSKANDGSTDGTVTSTLVRRKPKVHPHWTPGQRQVANVIDAWWFDLFISVLVGFNTILVLIETDKRASSYTPGAPDALRDTADGDVWIVALSQVLLFMYSVEISLRLFVYRLAFFHNKWNMFDLGIVGSDILVEFLTSIVEVVPESTLSIFGLLRILRALRFVRAIRTLTLFRELYMMLHGFVSSMRAIFWATILLLMMLCFWGVIAVELVHPINQDLAELGVYDGCDRCPYAFSSVAQAMLTFTQQIVAGDSWGVVTIPLMEYSPLITIPLFMIVFISIDLGILNLILTVIVDRAAQARSEDKRFVLQQQEEEFEAAKKGLMVICAQLDTDGSGQLTKEELMSGFDISDEFAEAMQLMDVQQEDMENLFKCLDEDDSGDIAYSEFVTNLHKMKSEDTHMMLIFLRSTVKDIRVKMKEEFTYLKENLAVRTEHIEADTKQLLSLAKTAKEQAPKASAARPATAGSADMAAGVMLPTLIDASKYSPVDSGQTTPLPLGPELARLRQQVQEQLARAARDIDSMIGGPRDDRRLLGLGAGPPPTRGPIGEALPPVPDAPPRNPSFLDGCSAPSRLPAERAAPATPFAVT